MQKYTNSNRKYHKIILIEKLRAIIFIEHRNDLINPLFKFINAFLLFNLINTLLVSVCIENVSIYIYIAQTV